MSSKRRKALVPILLVMGGLVVAVGLVVLAPRSEATVPERALPSVRTETARSVSVEAIVRSTGVPRMPS